MTIKITTPNGGSDSLDFGCAQTPVVATVTGTEVSSGEGKLELKTTTGGTSATKATVLANGNVGINVAAPTYKLDVNTGTAALGGVAVDLFRSGSLSSSTGGVLNLRPANGAAISNIHNLSIAAYDHSGDTNADGLSINAYDGVSFSTGSNSRQERMRITSAGNVGIGVTNPDLKMEIVDTSSGASKDALLLTNYGAASNTETGIFFSPTEADGAIRGARISALNDGANDSNSVALKFSTGLGAPPVERMRISSAGKVGIGTASPSAQLHLKQTSSDQFLKMEGATTNWGWRNQSDGTHGLFDFTNNRWAYLGNYTYWSIYTGGSERLRIAQDGSVGFGVGSPTVRIHLNGGTAGNSNSGIAAAWNVHSDYRLKENIVPLEGATSKVKRLKPVRFNWKDEEGTPAVDGFLAHEVSPVVPEAVLGEKDAVDEDGKPIMQGLDQSKLVPLLVKTIQELEARIAKLEENK